MNCLPTSKLLSGKTKNKYLLSATQKYEQRIKDAKQKQKPQFSLTSNKSTKPETKIERPEYNPCLDEWISKRKEIDKWRKSVLFALQIESLHSTSSSNVTDSQTQLESSTLTTSNTLCSASQANTKKLHNDKKPIATEEKFCKVPKSPSIPLYHSNAKGPMHDTNAAFLYNFYRQQNNDSAISIVDDDEVFEPSDSPHCSPGAAFSSSTRSSNQFNFPRFTDSVQSNSHKNESNINRKYTPQPTKRPFYLPVCHYNHRVQAQRCLYQNAKPESRIMNHVNSVSYKIPANQAYSYVTNHEIQSPSPKKTLHKNETTAKIILRPLNSSPSNDFQGRIPFQRTRSLNVKRSPYNLEQQSHQQMASNYYENVVHKFPDNGCASVKTKFSPKSSNPPTYGQSKFIVLKPTFSQENICSSSEPFYPQNGPLLKICSYNNLQSVTRQIPKVSINEPLTMKFVFGSEPSLLRNF